MTEYNNLFKQDKDFRVMVQIYYGEKCEGMVSTLVAVDRNKVIVKYDDGDISSTTEVWGYFRKDNKYYIIKTSDLNTSLDATLGKNPLEESVAETEAKNDKEAINELIERIIEPHKERVEYSMPFNIRKVRAGLRKALVAC